MQALKGILISLEEPGGGLIAPVVDGFAENGCDLRVVHQHTQWDFDDSDFLLTYGPMQPMGWAISRIKSIANVPPLIVWFTEQVPQPRQPAFVLRWLANARYISENSPGVNKWIRALLSPRVASFLLGKGGRYRCLGEMLALKQLGLLANCFVFSNTNLSVFHRVGLPATLVPMGYHRSFGEGMSLDRDVDVLFLGSTRDRRRHGLISRFEEQLAAKGVKLVIRDGSPKHGYVFGHERTVLLNRTKIVLNIMRQPWDDPVFRMLLAAPNGAMLLSERLVPASTGAFDPGTHFATADLPDMVDAIRYYLDKDDERERIAKQGLEYVTTQMTMGRMARLILRTLDLGRNEAEKA